METKPLGTNGRPGVGGPDPTLQNYDTMTGLASRSQKGAQFPPRWGSN
jgi:hypothetical protein